uniref:Uncharacterized protein n=1 Tax=Pristionchus pacificus TaxID=54126 RepID=A0A8R1YP79_PRIPA
MQRKGDDVTREKGDEGDIRLLITPVCTSTEERRPDFLLPERSKIKDHVIIHEFGKMIKIKSSGIQDLGKVRPKIKDQLCNLTGDQQPRAGSGCKGQVADVEAVRVERGRGLFFFHKKTTKQEARKMVLGLPLMLLQSTITLLSLYSAYEGNRAVFHLMLAAFQSFFLITNMYRFRTGSTVWHRSLRVYSGDDSKPLNELEQGLPIFSL